MLVGPAIFPLVAFPLVIFAMPVMLVSGVLMFCAFRIQTYYCKYAYHCSKNWDD